jgi:threonine aldolase
MYYKLSGVVKKVDYTGTAANSSAISAHVRYVRLYATTDCHISISNPAVTATAAMTPLQAKDFEYYKVSPGNIISVIRSSGNGSLYISELTE